MDEWSGAQFLDNSDPEQEQVSRVRVNRSFLGIGALAAIMVGALVALGVFEDSEPEVSGIEIEEAAGPVDEGDTSQRTSQTFPNPSSGTPDTTAPTTTTIRQLDGLDGPVFSTPTGLTLLMGGSDRIRRLDLDTGVVDEIEQSGDPLVAAGPLLVVQDQMVGGIEVVDLTDGSTVSSLSPDSALTVVSEDGQAWVMNYFGAPSSQLIDLHTDEVVVGADDRLALSSAWGPPRVGPIDLITGRSGGVYRVVGDRFERVDPGTLIAGNDSVVLIETCDEALECSSRWLDRSTMEPVTDLVEPPDGLFAPILSDTFWMARGPFWHPTSYFNVQTGDEREIPADVGPDTIVLSDSVVVMRTAQGVVLWHLDLDETVELPSSVTRGSWSAVLAPSGVSDDGAG